MAGAHVILQHSPCGGGGAEGENVHGGSGDDLVGPAPDGHQCKEGGEERSDERGNGDHRGGRTRDDGGGIAGDGAHEHHSFDADVDDAGALGDEFAAAGE